MTIFAKNFLPVRAPAVRVFAALLAVAWTLSSAWAQGVPATPNKPARTTSTPAAPKKPAPATEAAPAPGTMLTKEELRVCLKDKEDILAQRARLEKEQAANQSEREQIVAQTQVLKEAMATLDRTAPGVLDAHDAKVDAHEKRIDAWNQSHRQMLATIEALNKKQTQWTTDCGEKRYREEDEIAIRNGK
ncbi:MAG: hypothetical protein RI949_1711 [Pseudomonadota bacterium]